MRLDNLLLRLAEGNPDPDLRALYVEAASLLKLPCPSIRGIVPLNTVFFVTEPLVVTGAMFDPLVVLPQHPGGPTSFHECTILPLALWTELACPSWRAYIHCRQLKSIGRAGSWILRHGDLYAQSGLPWVFRGVWNFVTLEYQNDGLDPKLLRLKQWMTFGWGGSTWNLPQQTEIDLRLSWWKMLFPQPKHHGIIVRVALWGLILTTRGWRKLLRLPKALLFALR